MGHILAGDRQLTRYLLGNLSEQEQAELEDRYFRDDRAFADLLVAEDELIDAYVRGELPKGQREQFEERFLASSEQRARVEFARTLIDFTSPSSSPARADAAAGREELPAWWTWLTVRRGMQPAVLWSTCAAAALLVLGGGWLVSETMRLRNQTERFSAERAGFERQLATSEQRVAEEQRRSDRLAGELQRERAERAARPRSLIASFILTPGLVRGSGETKRLVIPAGIEGIRIQVDISEGGYQRYRAELQTVTGDQVWSGDGLRALDSATKRAVVLTIPSVFLSSGDYILKLSGLTSDGSLEDVDEYYFRVVRR